MPNYICMDQRCRARGKTQDLIIEECPRCGGDIAILADDEFINESFILNGTIDQIKYFLEEKMIHVSELQKTNEELTKKLQLETTLPDTYVICPHAKHCSLNDSCYLQFEYTTCLHTSNCPDNKHCIQANF